ncbi:uncharacterized protein EI97DRAFT_429623 [Westerdykella ornata]|uniref:Uncharacterized protein n=1 Tax=Westerdykella ornata TaxID=318751 RepID=A0A6A6K2J5_WESOR|nr:uncharacterized protein EI97DRAFT_429623 [Westerdykella ornata]KAF2281619.1 hypothetical protein EI97DRAFT_429623 [Westerdykella ornata]
MYGGVASPASVRSYFSNSGFTDCILFDEQPSVHLLNLTKEEKTPPPEEEEAGLPDLGSAGGGTQGEPEADSLFDFHRAIVRISVVGGRQHEMRLAWKLVGDKWCLYYQRARPFLNFLVGWYSGSLFGTAEGRLGRNAKEVASGGEVAESHPYSEEYGQMGTSSKVTDPFLGSYRRAAYQRAIQRSGAEESTSPNCGRRRISSSPATSRPRGATTTSSLRTPRRRRLAGESTSSLVGPEASTAIERSTLRVWRWSVPRAASSGPCVQTTAGTLMRHPSATNPYAVL